MFHRVAVFDAFVIIVIVAAAVVAAVCLIAAVIFAFRSISTSPPGGNQVDGLPPVCSKLLDLELLWCDCRPAYR